MNKIIPFNKDITFNNGIGEITSIALDDTLSLVDSHSIRGDLIVRGCNKNQNIEEEFSYSLPVDITIDSKYDTSKCSINIDDFYYEIMNENILKVKIDLIIDDLFFVEPVIQKEKIKIEDNLSNYNSDRLNIDASVIKKDKDWDIDVGLKEDTLNIDFSLEKNGEMDNKKVENTSGKNIEDLFKETNNEREYSVYRVYTVGENDSLEYIMDKYKVSRDDLADYNDLTLIAKGMKLVIPSVDE